MLDLFGLGNAIVDTEVNVNDAFLTEQEVGKGLMNLVDDDRMASLLTALTGHETSQCGGGSAANTTYAVQAFGLQTAYTFRVAKDAVGHFFVDSMKSAGVRVSDHAMHDHGHSGQCLVLITPDAERSMNTNLGISAELQPADVNFELLEQSRYFYVEGYMSSVESGTAAAVACREHAEKAGVPVSISLSDPAMVEFCRGGLEAMLGNGVDSVFCNEEEALAWTRTDRLDIAMNELKDLAKEVYVTVGAAGSIVISAAGQQQADGYPTQAIDTTGAGDMYAGATLAARLSGADPIDAARFANHCASTIVAQYGARLGQPDEYRLLRERFE